MILNNAIKILYVEDDLLTNELLTDALKLRYVNVISEINGLKGLKSFQKEKPDLIITDLNMPIMCGCEMIQKIRKIDYEIPIIVVTAHEDEYVKKINFLSKPVNVSDLYLRIDKTIEGKIIPDVISELNLMKDRHVDGIYCSR